MERSKKMNEMKKTTKILALILVLVLALPMTAAAVSDSSYDMTYPGTDIVISETINGAIWESLPSTLPTGSGVFDAFFRVQAKGDERGYNTDGRPVQFDELTSATFTHSAFFDDVPLIEYPEGSDLWYYEFQLDINENSNTPLISLDEFELYTTNDQYLLNYPFEDGIGGTDSGEAKLVYNLDGDGETWIKMDYKWNTGSGKRDYRVLIPQGDFADKELTYVVIYTEHGFADGAYTSDDGFEEWGVDIYPPEPNTLVTITASDIQVYVGGTISLTVTEENTGNDDLTSPYVYLEPLCYTLNKASSYYVSGDAGTVGVLDVGETWTWIVTGVVVGADTTYTATGHGTDSLGNDVTYPDYLDEQDEILVDTIETDTLVTITPSVWETFPGGNVILNITEQNTGDVDLTSPYIELYDGTSTTTYDNTSPEFVAASDTDGDGELDTDETWFWSILTTISTTTTFTATGHGTDPLGNDVTYPQYPNEQASAEVKTGGATRTLGFWKTHPDFTTHVFETYLGSNINISWRNITNMEDLMGIFWANTAKNDDGSKRDKLCQAKEQAARQAVAAILNSALPNGAPLPVELSEIQSILAGNNIGAIRALGATLDEYNNSGDDIALTGVPATGRANPKVAKDIANIPFANCP